MNKTARNERRTITATAINNLAVAFVVIGVVVPLIGGAYQLAVPQTRYWWLFALLSFAAASAFHLISRQILGGIEE